MIPDIKTEVMSLRAPVIIPNPRCLWLIYLEAIFLIYQTLDWCRDTVAEEP